MKIKITQSSRTVEVPVKFVPADKTSPDSAPKEPQILLPTKPEDAESKKVKNVPRSSAPAKTEETPEDTKTPKTPEDVETPETPENAKSPKSPEPAKSAKSAKSSKFSKSPKSPKSSKSRKFPKPKAWLGCLFAGFFIALLVFSGLKIYQWYRDDQINREQQAEASEDAGVKEVASEGELVNPPTDEEDDYWYYINLPFYEVDFNELLAKNPDTVAFIHMNNTNVNYPVVQTVDNDYYLKHAFDGSYNDAGWVFMDYRSSLNPPSDNTVIYGHGRYNGTVFGSLQNVLTADWQNNKDNYVIWLSTPQENLLYQIFSVYSIDAEGYYLKQNFLSEDDKAAWLDTMKSRNIAPTGSTAIASDSILTLSTCKNDFGSRIVVQAKLIKRQAR